MFRCTELGGLRRSLCGGVCEGETVCRLVFLGRHWGGVG